MMTSTLRVRKTPKTVKTWNFKIPVKQAVARRFYDHDGSGGGEMLTLGPEHLDWFEGLRAGSTLDAVDSRNLDAILAVLRSGDTIDMWFEQ